MSEMSAHPPLACARCARPIRARNLLEGRNYPCRCFSDVTSTCPNWTADDGCGCGADALRAALDAQETDLEDVPYSPASTSTRAEATAFLRDVAFRMSAFVIAIAILAIVGVMVVVL